MLPKIQQQRRGNSAEAQMAGFIVGCLIFEEVIQVDETDQDQQKIAAAFRMVLACLRETKAIPRDADSPIMPFEW